jgi:hypothetical protein
MSSSTLPTGLPQAARRSIRLSSESWSGRDGEMIG